MKWFSGSIPEAITKAKNDRAVFVVYITGEDDQSKQMDSTWEEPSVDDLCQKAKFVGLKLEAKSEASAQFCQIYPVVCVPCTFYIGENGVPLEITGGFQTPADLLQKITTVLEMHKAQLSGSQVTPTPSGDAQQTHTAEVAPSLLSQSEAVSETVSMSSGHQSSQDKTQASGVSEGESTAATASTQSHDAPAVYRAQDLIAHRREEKDRKKKEDEKAKEKERRQLGQNLGKFAQWKNEMEAKELKDQMKKDREEEKKARERIRQQIAKDREERAARFQKEKLEREQAKMEAAAAKEASRSQQEARDAAVRSQTARIQFRLPDGSSITQQFPSSDTLETARQFLKEQTGNTLGNFSLMTTYPRREFKENDMSQTLLDLQLAPSAALVVIPGSKNAVCSSPGGGGADGFVWTLLWPLLALWNFVSSFLFGSASQPQGAYNNQPPAPQTSTQTSTATGARPKSSYGLRSRREGNMRRFYGQDEDDDAATWNGNSTQQM